MYVDETLADMNNPRRSA